MDLETAFGQALRQLRYERELSQEALAYESGLDRSYLSELENGKKLPSLLTVFRLAEAMNISASELVVETESELLRQNQN